MLHYGTFAVAFVMLQLVLNL